MADSTFLNVVDESYSGGAFHPRLEKGRASGTLRVDSSGVHFETEGARVEFPLRDLEVTMGGAGNRLVFFRHPQRPEWSVYTADRRVLKHPALADDPGVEAQARRARRQRVLAFAAVLGVLGFFASLVILLVLAKEPMVRALAAQVPPEWEKKAGTAVWEQIRAEKHILDSPDLARDIDGLTQPLLAGIPSPRYGFRFHVIEDPTINAFALPGGEVVVHSGLILAAETPEEVAGVLAHEIAHVTRQHALRQVIEAAGLFAVVQAFLGDASGLIAVIADNAMFLRRRMYSRDMEREADDEAWRFLMASGIDPRGLLRFFERIHAEREELLKKNPLARIDESLGFLSTHPDTKERIERLKERWEREESKSGFREFPNDFSGTKQHVRALLHLPDPKSP